MILWACWMWLRDAFARPAAVELADTAPVPDPLADEFAALEAAVAEREAAAARKAEFDTWSAGINNPAKRDEIWREINDQRKREAIFAERAGFAYGHSPDYALGMQNQFTDDLRRHELSRQFDNDGQRQREMDAGLRNANPYGWGR